MDCLFPPVSTFTACMDSCVFVMLCFFFSSRRRHTRCLSDWSSDVCSSDLSCRIDDLETILNDHCTPSIVPLPHEVPQEAPPTTPYDTSGSRGEPETPA